MDEQDWIGANAAQARRALADPAVRTRLLALLGTDDRDRRHQRRLEAARAEVAGLRLRWTIGEDTDRWEP